MVRFIGPSVAFLAHREYHHAEQQMAQDFLVPTDPDIASTELILSKRCLAGQIITPEQPQYSDPPIIKILQKITQLRNFERDFRVSRQPIKRL